MINISATFSQRPQSVDSSHSIQIGTNDSRRPIAEIRINDIKWDMPALLHEYWENEDGGQFGPVRELTDKQRSELLPNARFVFSLYASSWFEARKMEYHRLGYGQYIPPDGFPDEPYTANEEAEQNQYLKNRPPVP